MMASRGMGDISPSKMPKGVRKARRDNTDFTQYAEGGAVWEKARPENLGAPKKLSPAKKADRKSTRLNSSHVKRSRMPSSA